MKSKKSAGPTRIERDLVVNGATLSAMTRGPILNAADLRRRSNGKRTSLIAGTVVVAIIGTVLWFVRQPPSQPAMRTAVVASTTAVPAATTAPPSNTEAPLSLEFEPANTTLVKTAMQTPIRVKRGDSLSLLFQRAGLPASTWHTLLGLGDEVEALRHLHPGDVLHIKKTPNGELAALEYAIDPVRTLHVSHTDGQWSATITHSDTTVRTVRIAGRIKHSLLAAVHNAGASLRTAANLAHILRWRVDLSHSIQPGDQFVLIYQQHYADQQLVGSGPILAAQIKTGQRTVTAFRYTDKHGHSAYYDASGKSLRPSIMRTPVKYTRVSSHFDLHRFNPVLHVYRPHYGVDLAAPKGTPIKAAANGRVKFVGHEGGYGRLVILKNFGPYSTRYGHMSRFADGLEKGDHVKQGQIIGYVGESGVATGPHLHYEIRVNGVAKPPLKVDLPAGAPITGAGVATFKHKIAPLMAQLNRTPAADRTLLAHRQAPAAGHDEQHQDQYEMVAALGPIVGSTRTDPDSAADSRRCRKKKSDDDTLPPGACLG